MGLRLDIASRCGAAAAAVFCLVWSPPVHGQVTQPNGSLVPLPVTGNSLQTLFNGRGEALNYRTDPVAEPSTFAPTCGFSGTLVLHDAGCKMDFGWYNVNLSSTTPPPDSEIYTLVGRNQPLNSTFSADIIQNDPNYQGGLIGFAIKKTSSPCTQTQYSELRIGKQYCPMTANPPSCPVDAPHWSSAVIYKSTAVADAYYVAFEDQAFQYNTPSPNDQDFNDDVYFVTGLKECVEAGNPCDTGLPGVCGAGTKRCSEGVVTCSPLAMPSSETCNGVDDDCDGKADNGSNLCGAGKVCDKGACVGFCSEGGCPFGQVCNTTAGLCTDPQCANVTCPEGQRCKAGQCVAPCSGVVCPAGESCRLGRCVDSCANINCGQGAVCSNGTCYADCRCKRCAAGSTCRQSDGRCVDSDCLDSNGKDKCTANQVCNSSGQCLNRCQGAVCPSGQVCDAAQGRCVDPCAGVNCKASEVCNAQGQCEDACLNAVKCSVGFVCKDALCRDACDFQQCDTGAGYYCERGLCVNGCEMIDCSGQPGTTCLAGACVDACIVVAPTCKANEKCVAGACVDACLNAGCGPGFRCVGQGVCEDLCKTMSCPSGQTCSVGACKPTCVVNGCGANQMCNQSTGACDPIVIGGQDAAAGADGGDAGAGTGGMMMAGSGGASGAGGSATGGAGGVAGSGAGGDAGSGGNAGASGTAGGNAGASGAAGGNAGASGTAGGGMSGSGESPDGGVIGGAAGRDDGGVPTDDDAGGAAGSGGAGGNSGGATAGSSGAMAGASGGTAGAGGRAGTAGTTAGAGGAGGTAAAGSGGGTNSTSGGCGCDLGRQSPDARGALILVGLVGGWLARRRRRA